VALLFRELSYAINGAAMEVHSVLGPGFLEVVYQAALAHELGLRHLAVEQFRRLPVTYKGVLVGDYVADMVVEGKIIVEIKAVVQLIPRHRAQALNYLTASGLRLALLYNFGSDSLQKGRVVRGWGDEDTEGHGGDEGSSIRVNP
jgi:GxxExxY protein